MVQTPPHTHFLSGTRQCPALGQAGRWVRGGPSHGRGLLSPPQGSLEASQGGGSWHSASRLPGKEAVGTHPGKLATAQSQRGFMSLSRLLYQSIMNY